MNTILNLLKDCVVQIEKKFEYCRTSVIETGVDAWYNRAWGYECSFRRAHLEVLNEVENHGVYLIHFTIFPHVDDPSPVFGMDFVCSNGVLVGAFHDFSPLGPSKMNDWFLESVKDIVPDKRRVLPEWMFEVASKGMVSTTAISDYEEAKMVVDKLLGNLDYYLENVGERTGVSYVEEYNKYCVYQKKNPHIKHMLKSFGYDMDMVESFIQIHLFPEIQGLDFSI